jgi:uncharacterized protein
MSADVQVLQKKATYTLPQLATLAEDAFRAAGCEKAVAFGSYARGTADGYSDLDVAIVIPTARSPLDRGDLVRQLHDAVPVPLDAIVFTPEEFRDGLERATGVFAAIADHGVTIYARPGA